MTPEEARTQLEAAGDRLRALGNERLATLAEIGRLARQARGLVPIAQIAELSGISRPTVYKMLEGE